MCIQDNNDYIILHGFKVAVYFFKLFTKTKLPNQSQILFGTLNFHFRMKASFLKNVTEVWKVYQSHFYKLFT